MDWSALSVEGLGKVQISVQMAEYDSALQTVYSSLSIYTSSCVALALCCGDGHWAPQTRYMLRRNEQRL